ncbi:MAG: DUF2231 domain-containing protein [Anaerolineae bacterium]|nr:DUF2231 domain-containing protein [Gemmatimonadaceae bacterium]
MKSTARIGTHPIHPMLIAFPLSLYVLSFAADVWAGLTDKYHYIGYYLAIGAVVGAAIAAIPGVIDLLTAIPEGTQARRTAWKHGLLNIGVLLLFLISILTRGHPSSMTYLSYATAGIGVVLLAFSGWLGGTLVYDHKVGVPDVPLDDRR